VTSHGAGADAAAVFDAAAAEYEAQLARGLSLAGEGRDYFARGRVDWVARRLRELGASAGRVLDFGCGDGAAVPLLLGLPGALSAVGVDVSRESLDRAQRTNAGLPASFVELDRFAPAGDFSLAYCNGVFHHIPLDERDRAARAVYDALAPGGLFAFWENNAWNPGTRWVMSRVPFDRDAIPLSPPVARRLLRGAGFEVLRTDFLFVFPHLLRALRVLERALSPLPLGGQFLVLCRRPVDGARR
jgi:SAM-dependent methyltransferase